MDLKGHIRELETIHEVLEGEIDDIVWTTVIFSHTDKLKIPELSNMDTDPPEKLKDNGAMPLVSTQPYPPHSTPEDSLVASAEPPPCPRVKSGDAALQARVGYLSDVRLLGADYMLYGVYQDWVHQDPGEHLDGGISEDSKWQARWKKSFV